MPFTVLAHQAVVLPLKFARPHWVSGTALVVGSMAPDFDYFLRGDPYGPIGHTLRGQVTFCLPLTLLGVFLVHALAATIARELPDAGTFHLRDLSMLGASPLRPGPILVGALVGSLSHIAWDGFTHEHGWAVARIPALGWPVYKVLQHSSTVVGAVVTLLLLRRIGQGRLLARWAEVDPAKVDALPAASTKRRALLVAGILVGALGGAVMSLGVPREDLLRLAVCVFLRATLGGVVGLVIAAFSLQIKARLPS